MSLQNEEKTPVDVRVTTLPFYLSLYFIVFVIWFMGFSARLDEIANHLSRIDHAVYAKEVPQKAVEATK